MVGYKGCTEVYFEKQGHLWVDTLKNLFIRQTARGKIQKMLKVALNINTIANSIYLGEKR